jgi:hypothetical protein
MTTITKDPGLSDFKKGTSHVLVREIRFQGVKMGGKVIKVERANSDVASCFIPLQSKRHRNEGINMVYTDEW